MKSKKKLVCLTGVLLVCSLFYAAVGGNDKKDVQSDPSAARLLKTEKARRVYNKLRKKDPLIFPAALTAALDDLKQDRKKRDDSAFLISQARIRHLIGDSFPSDFAIDLAEMEKSFIEKARAARFPVQEIGDEQKELFKTVTPAAFLAYFPPEQIRDDRFEVIDSAAGEDGFSATAFQDADGNVIIAFRGSDDTKDLADARRIAEDLTPVQFDDAERFYNKIRKKHPDAPVLATGHSLGGSLAQLLATRHPDVTAFPCNPVGIKRLVQGNASEDNIFNLIVESDPFSFALPQAGLSLSLRPDKKDPSGHPLHPHSVFYCYYP